jgi:hypothetical protein
MDTVRCQVRVIWYYPHKLSFRPGLNLYMSKRKRKSLIVNVNVILKYFDHKIILRLNNQNLKDKIHLQMLDTYD